MRRAAAASKRPIQVVRAPRRRPQQGHEEAVDVEERQDVQQVVVGPPAPGGVQGPHGRAQVAVGDDRALGAPGGAGGVAEDRPRLGGERGRQRDGVGGVEGRPQRGGGDPPAEGGHDRRVEHGHPGAAVVQVEGDLIGRVGRVEQGRHAEGQGREAQLDGRGLGLLQGQHVPGTQPLGGDQPAAGHPGVQLPVGDPLVVEVHRDPVGIGLARPLLLVEAHRPSGGPRLTARPAPPGHPGTPAIHPCRGGDDRPPGVVRPAERKSSAASPSETTCATPARSSASASPSPATPATAIPRTRTPTWATTGPTGPTEPTEPTEPTAPTGRRSPTATATATPRARRLRRRRPHRTRAPPSCATGSTTTATASPTPISTATPTAWPTARTTAPSWWTPSRPPRATAPTSAPSCSSRTASTRPCPRAASRSGSKRAPTTRPSTSSATTSP